MVWDVLDLIASGMTEIEMFAGCRHWGRADFREIYGSSARVGRASAGGGAA